MFGYAGRILRINLNSGAVYTEPTSKYAREWIGGSGFGIKILYDELRPWTTPYEPANKLIFGAGPLTGTMAPGANKMNVCTLGPMINGWATSCSDSYVSGELKRCGYDSIVIEGKAHCPVFLSITEHGVELRDACHLWGKTTRETLEQIRKELKDPTLHVISIGPAGENLVRGAAIIQDTGRAFGRCGIGAVMGSKNLKAIVAKGNKSINVFQHERFVEAVKKARKLVRTSGIAKKFHKYGTLMLFPHKQEVCGISYKNFQYCRIPEDMAAVVYPLKTVEKYTIAPVSFPGCGVGGCGRRMHITEGPYAGLVSECNQWEVFGTLQARLAIWEPTFMIKVNDLCNELGMDVDAVGGAIGWAMECYQRGILDESDTDGLKLNWGDAEVALELTRKMAYREGFGALLAEGCARAADILGRDSGYYALHIKGQDLYEPLRGSNAWALGTTTSTRGGGHTTGAPVHETAPNLDTKRAKEVFGVDNADQPQSYEGKAQMVKVMEVVHRVCNCLGVCIWNTVALELSMQGVPEMAEMYSALTGLETSIEDFEELTTKQLNLEKAFNLRFTNFDRKDDMPTPRDLREAIPTGSLAGWKIDEDQWNQMLDEYYDIHGWDRATSFPKRETLERLGMKYVADELERIGKLK